MRFKLVFAGALLLVLSNAAHGSDVADSEAIQGTWLASTAELNGNAFSDEVRKSIKLVLKDDHYTVTVGKQTNEWTMKLNPTAKLKEMDITRSAELHEGKTLLAIYELDGDTLRICYDLYGKNRPQEFKTSEKAPALLITYSRERP